MPSLFAGFVHPIHADQVILVIKDERSKLEADAVMFALILAVLSFVPLVAHLYIQSVSRKSIQPVPRSGVPKNGFAPQGATLRSEPVLMHSSKRTDSFNCS